MASRVRLVRVAEAAFAVIFGLATATRAQEPVATTATTGDVPPVLIPWPEPPGADDDPLIPLLPKAPAPKQDEGALPALDTSTSPLPKPPAGQPPVATTAAAAAASPKAEVTKKEQGKLSEDELNVLVPSLSVPAIGAKVAVTEMTPPTQDVRRWQFAKVEGLTWESEETFQDGDWIVLRGKVDVRAGIERIRADEIRLDTHTRKLEAEGSVVLDRLDSRLTGRRLEYDTNTNTGVMFDALGYTADDLSFTADVAEKVAENKYVLHGATFTSCTQPSPIWQVNATKAVVEIDRFAYLWNPRVRFGKVPLTYLPWIAFPIKQERTTGFMIPRISSSSVRGTSVSEDFFWAINRSTDLTVGGTWWDRYGYRANMQARWFLPGMTEYGYIEGVYLKANKGKEDPKLERERYDVNWDHHQQLGQWDLTFTGEIGTDPFVQDSDPVDLSGNAATTNGSGLFVDRSPILNQKLTLQRRWGKNSLNIYMENDERGRVLGNPPSLTPGPLAFPAPQPDPDLKDAIQTTTSRSLPLAEWRASGIQLGGKKWATFDVEGSVGHLVHGVKDDYKYPFLDANGVTRIVKSSPTLAMHDYTRADVYPQFSFPLGNGWLRVIPEVNLRATYWSRLELDSNAATPTTIDTFAQTGTLPTVPDPNANPQTYTFQETQGVDDGKLLWGWDAGVRIEGPDLERIYNADAQPGERKWQHVIEPSIEYAYAPELDPVNIISSDQQRSYYSQRFPSTRTVTGFGSTIQEGGTNEARLRLVNTIRSKRIVPPGSTPAQPRDIVIWTLSSTWDLDRTEQETTFQEGPVHASPVDCNGDMDATDPGELANQRCLRLETSRVANIQSDFNVRPTDLIHFSLRNTYDTLTDDITSTNLTGGLDWNAGYLDVSFGSTRDTHTTKVNRSEMSLTGENWIYKGGRFRIGYDLTREIDPRTPVTKTLHDAAGNVLLDPVTHQPVTEKVIPTPWIYKHFVLSYYNQCVGLSLSWEDNANRGIRREKEWTFIVSLKDLGNFLRYRRRITAPRQ